MLEGLIFNKTTKSKLVANKNKQNEFEQSGNKQNGCKPIKTNQTEILLKFLKRHDE